MHVLVVEDDELIGDGLQTGLAALGVAAEWVRSAAAAETALGVASFDMVVLDLGLPDEDGTAFVAALAPARRGAAGTGVDCPRCRTGSRHWS